MFSFRGGRAVAFEAMDTGQNLADDMLVAGIIDGQRHAALIAAIPQEAESTDLAIAELAIGQGALLPSALEQQLARRLRAKLVQATTWSTTRYELDADPDGLAGIRETPIDVGPSIYLGVRTFYDDSHIDAVLARGRATYLRLLGEEAEAAAFFQLGAEERTFLSTLEPEISVNGVLHLGAIDPGDGWHLVCALVISGLAEVSEQRFSMASAAVTVRPTGPARSSAPPQQRHVPAPVSSVAPAAATAPPVAMAPQPPSARVAAVPVSAPVASPLAGRGPAPVSIPAQDRVPRESMVAPDRHSSAAPAPRSSIPARNPSHPSRSSEPSRPSVPASASSPPQSRSDKPRRRSRKMSVALQGLDRQLRGRKPTAGGARAVPSGPLSQPPASNPPGRDRSHVEQLIRMRQAAQSQGPRRPRGNPEELFGRYRDATRHQRFGAAADFMSQVMEIDPDNEVFEMHHLLAQLRAKRAKPEQLKRMKLLLREHVNEELQQGFVYYAMGHLALEEGNDELAEKCFRRASELDKSNRDAERYYRIVELKRKHAEEAKGNKIFGIEVGGKKG
ncbi:MAG: hypothetical protein OEZ06_02720 [Myxococcales bacterium]|nr:hypothetical protein [Myxococcales bacterium]